MVTALLDRFERSRSLALALSSVITVAWIAGSLWFTGVEITTAIWSALGVSGTVYYLLHYRSALRRSTNESFSRSFTRLFPFLLLFTSLLQESWAVGRALVFGAGVLGVVLLYALSYSVDFATDDPGHQSGPGGGESDGASGEALS